MSRTRRQSKLEDPLQHVGFRGAGRSCVNVQLRQEVGDGLAVLEPRSSGSRCRLPPVSPVTAAKSFVTNSRVVDMRFMRAKISADDGSEPNPDSVSRESSSSSARGLGGVGKETKTQGKTRKHLTHEANIKKAIDR